MTGAATRRDLWEASAAAFPARTHRCCRKSDGETCHVERWFGTLRARVSRLVRKAYSFSKHPENHLDAIHFFITNYNLQIKQSTSVSTLPPGNTKTPFHSHSGQWEFYHVLEGQGKVRDQERTTPIEAGDAFVFKPNEPHQIINDNTADLILYVVADNPLSESAYLPNEETWIVWSPKFTKVRFVGDKVVDSED